MVFHYVFLSLTSLARTGSVPLSQVTLLLVTVCWWVGGGTTSGRLCYYLWEVVVLVLLLLVGGGGATSGRLYVWEVGELEQNMTNDNQQQQL